MWARESNPGPKDVEETEGLGSVEHEEEPGSSEHETASVVDSSSSSTTNSATSSSKVSSRGKLRWTKFDNKAVCKSMHVTSAMLRCTHVP